MYKIRSDGQTNFFILNDKSLANVFSTYLRLT